MDPFKNGSCYEMDRLEPRSIYGKRHKGSTYSVQVCLSFDFKFFAGSLAEMAKVKAFDKDRRLAAPLNVSLLIKLIF